MHLDVYSHTNSLIYLFTLLFIYLLNFSLTYLFT
jgi:hypothetical protein